MVSQSLVSRWLFVDDQRREVKLVGGRVCIRSDAPDTQATAGARDTTCELRVKC